MEAVQSAGSSTGFLRWIGTVPILHNISQRQVTIPNYLDHDHDLDLDLDLDLGVHLDLDLL